MEVCQECGQEFKTKQALLAHERAKHAAPDSKTALSTRSAPVEQLIQFLRLPKERRLDGFEDGVHYGINSILIGVRVAQELSRMGIEQARPLISMAQEMRQAEGMAAERVATELAQAVLAGNEDIKKAIHQQGAASSSDPVTAMMVQAFQPIFPQLLGRALAGMMGGQPPQPGQTPQGGQQMAPGGPKITYHSKEELEEEEQ
jgi:hypothetical protein